MSLVVQNLGKTIGEPPNRVLTDLSFEIAEGEFVALTGRSGSGKSTLLYLLSSLDNPTEGDVQIDGHSFQKMKAEELNDFRRQLMGFVFQFHYLIAELSAIENVLLPTRKSQIKESAHFKQRAIELLDRFDLKGKYDRLPRQLSGGEQQRVAIARSLIMEPKYLFADEPTGSLDSINSEIVMDIIKKTNAEQKTTVIMVTHDGGFAKQAHRQIEMKDGQIVRDTQQRAH